MHSGFIQLVFDPSIVSNRVLVSKLPNIIHLNERLAVEVKGPEMFKEISDSRDRLIQELNMLVSAIVSGTNLAHFYLWNLRAPSPTITKEPLMMPALTREGISYRVAALKQYTPKVIFDYLGKGQGAEVQAIILKLSTEVSQLNSVDTIEEVNYSTKWHYDQLLEVVATWDDEQVQALHDPYLTQKIIADLNEMIDVVPETASYSCSVISYLNLIISFSATLMANYYQIIGK